MYLNQSRLILTRFYYNQNSIEIMSPSYDLFILVIFLKFIHFFKKKFLKEALYKEFSNMYLINDLIFNFL